MVKLKAHCGRFRLQSSVVSVAGRGLCRFNGMVRCSLSPIPSIFTAIPPCKGLLRDEANLSLAMVCRKIRLKGLCGLHLTRTVTGSFTRNGTGICLETPKVKLQTNRPLSKWEQMGSGRRFEDDRRVL
jgi:hypothetical protein